ncbi:MAG: DinB family protein, partial [Candidatus Limnocylindrales bacterium]
MSDPTADPTLDRLLRHMAWANAALLARLADLPDSALALASPRNEWTVAMILEHVVMAAGGYAARLEGAPRPERTVPPTTVAELAELATRYAAYDARIRAQAAVPDGPA